jgi:hypothetical protein
MPQEVYSWCSGCGDAAGPNLKIDFDHNCADLTDDGESGGRNSWRQRASMAAADGSALVRYHPHSRRRRSMSARL